MKMSYVRLLADKFDDCYDFYKDVLGFAPAWGKKGETYASFKVNEDMLLSIFKRELMTGHIKEENVKRNINEHHAVLVFETDDVDGAYYKLSRLGISCYNEPHDMPGWGIRCFHIKDPEGNLIEINKELSKEQWSDDLKEHSDA